MYYYIKIKSKVTLVGKKQLFSRFTKIILIHGANKKNIIINENAKVFCMIYSCKNGKVSIGYNSQIGPYSRINCINNIQIGNNTIIAQNVIITDNNSHPIDPQIRLRMMSTPLGSIERSWIGSDNKPIIIGNNVWIGENSRINKGVKIGDNSIIGANSVVTKDIPANTIAAGNPAKIVKIDIDRNTVSKFSANE